MVQNFVVFPCRCASRASSKRRSSLPDDASRSIWRSHSSQSRSRSHLRSSANSEEDNCWICCSSCSSLVMFHPRRLYLIDRFGRKFCRDVLLEPTTATWPSLRGERRCLRICASGNEVAGNFDTTDNRHRYGSKALGADGTDVANCLPSW